MATDNAGQCVASNQGDHGWEVLCGEAGRHVVMGEAHNRGTHLCHGCVNSIPISVVQPTVTREGDADQESTQCLAMSVSWLAPKITTGARYWLKTTYCCQHTQRVQIPLAVQHLRCLANPNDSFKVNPKQTD